MIRIEPGIEELIEWIECNQFVYSQFYHRNSIEKPEQRPSITCTTDAGEISIKRDLFGIRIANKAKMPSSLTYVSFIL